LSTFPKVFPCYIDVWFLTLVYGRESILPPHVLLPSLQLSQKIQEEDCPPLENRINSLMKLEEVRAQAKSKLDQHQLLVKS